MGELLVAKEDSCPVCGQMSVDRIEFHNIDRNGECVLCGERHSTSYRECKVCGTEYDMMRNILNEGKEGL